MELYGAADTTSSNFPADVAGELHRKAPVPMGYSISWIAFHGKGKREVLALTHLIDTGEFDEANESPISAAEIPNGWYVLFLNDFSHPYVSVEVMQRFSADCVLLGCRVEEHVMTSAAFLFENGSRIWSVSHESEKGRYNVETEGTPPAFFAPLRAKLSQSQDDAGGEKADVDYMFDVPLEMAARLCGYRHDLWKFEWGEPEFTRMEIANS
jgi:hypothetical protein